MGHRVDLRRRAAVPNSLAIAIPNAANPLGLVTSTAVAIVIGS